MPPKNGIMRSGTLTEQLVAWVRREVWRSPEGGGKAILSERKLAETYGVSRTTARRALRRLMEDGYLVSVPRQGYLVSSAAPRGEGVVALVRLRSQHAEERDTFNGRLLDAMERSAAARDRDLLFVGREGRSAAEMAAGLCERGVLGVIADCGDMDFTRELRNCGLPVVAIDGADPQVESVVQDNFGGALLATRMLIERGHRRIACMLYDQVPETRPVHYQERRAGYLAAMDEAGLPVSAEWIIAAARSPSGGSKLAELAGTPDGPTAAVVLWCELMSDVGRALQAAKLDIELCVWWGALPERAASWRVAFPELSPPLGVSWDPGELTRRTLEQLEELGRNPDRPAARTVIPLRATGKESD